jgi:fructose-1,6-bisphosphatase/inositol monophosphatase family enzyme
MHSQHVVSSLLREASERIVLPRFRRLREGDIEEKSPGEVVTIVDREVEASLALQLGKLIPGSRVVGEESCAGDPSMMSGMQSGTVWVLDPLDGTGNFIAGDERFAILLALLVDGQIAASWMYVPLGELLYTAEQGGGAWCNGEKLAIKSRETLPSTGIIKTRFLPPEIKSTVAAGSSALSTVQAGANCTAIDYPAIVRGDSDFALYWRTLPWDHAPGVLLLREAGGHVARSDGTPYLPHDAREGLLAAASHDGWLAAQRLLGFDR